MKMNLEMASCDLAQARAILLLMADNSRLGDNGEVVYGVVSLLDIAKGRVDQVIADRRREELQS